ncbi:MAG: ABC transporter [Clostridiales bacterium]|nr:ABC transporter [Clostridiales bacterium]
MSAIYRKELKSYFSSIMGYLFIAVMLIAAGIYTMIYNLSYQYAVFEYVYASVTFIYLIVIPILTMRSFPEEKKQKTDQLLYSLPIKMSEIVFGKYFAALTVLAIPTVVMGIYPLILSSFGTFNLAIVYSTMVYFFLLGAALISVCMFVSTLVESQILAAIFSFLVVFVAYFADNITRFSSSSIPISLALIIIFIAVIALTVNLLTKNKFLSQLIAIILVIATIVLLIVKSSLIEGVASAVLEKIALFEQMYNVIYGTVDFSGIVYMLSVIALFNFFSVQVLEKRRWA